jgi:hypothetical protein
VLVVEGVEVGDSNILLVKRSDDGQSLQGGGDVRVHWATSCSNKDNNRGIHWATSCSNKINYSQSGDVKVH